MNQERKRILEMVQNGTLSAEEAIILLEALEKKKDVPAEADEQVKEMGGVLGGYPDQEEAHMAGPSTGHESEPTAGPGAGQKDTAGQGARSDKWKSDKDSKEDNFYSQLENAGEKIFDFVNHALTKIKQIDLQFNQSVDIPHVFQQAGDNVEKIDIDVANGPIRVVSWDQQEVRVECQAKVYRSEDREDARKYFLENTVFSAENGLLCFATQSKWMRVEATIHVPKKLYKKISVRIFNGGLTCEELQTSQFTVKTTNGKVDLLNLDGEKIDIDTVNGQIKLAGSRAEQLEAETVNGTIDVSGAFRNVELQSFNGNISCTLPDTGTQRVEAKAVTGNISLYLPSTSTLDGDIRSNLGNYKLDLEDINVLHEKKEIIQKQVKFKRTGADGEITYVLADTKTGSVTVGKSAQQEL